MAKAGMKYHNKKTVVDGITFASKKEAARWSELKLLEKAGLIKDLERQVVFRLIVNNKLVCRYLADFRYTTAEGKDVIEDAKGYKTSEYILKRKLMSALGWEITEV